MNFLKSIRGTARAWTQGHEVPKDTGSSKADSSMDQGYEAHLSQDRLDSIGSDKNILQ